MAARELREQQQKLEKSDFSNVVQTSLNMIVTGASCARVQTESPPPVAIQHCAVGAVRWRAAQRPWPSGAPTCMPQPPPLQQKQTSQRETGHRFHGTRATTQLDHSSQAVGAPWVESSSLLVPRVL